MHTYHIKHPWKLLRWMNEIQHNFEVIYTSSIEHWTKNTNNWALKCIWQLVSQSWLFQTKDCVLGFTAITLQIMVSQERIVCWLFFFAYFESKLPESQHMMLGFAKHYRQRQKNAQKTTDHSPQIRIWNLQNIVLKNISFSKVGGRQGRVLGGLHLLS